MNNTVSSFPPLASNQAKVLILGSMPGEESLRQQQYYAHPRNSFWYIMEKMLKINSELDYAAKTKILMQNRIAVWDVLKTCIRKGSLDSSIENSSITPNDFESFYSTHPNINHIFFNGTKAEIEYQKHVIPKISDRFTQIKSLRLPSTSPAMAKLTPAEKLSNWLIILEELT
jgi:TDG/mug DNA glycosylase family protein